MKRIKSLETRTRSWVKSIVWRLLGIFILGFISWLVTHSWKEMTLITIIFHTIRLILYYFHERLWEAISWGRIKHPLSDLPVKGKLKEEDKKIIEEKLRELGYID